MLAVLDWMMPGMTGPELCSRIRTLPTDEPPYLILLTSLVDKADVVAGLGAGADDYLAKPFDPDELRARVEVGGRLVELQKRLREARDCLAEAATHDPLTGALNRRAFDENLARAVSAQERHGDGMALGICDVDEFKKINDRHGHQVGDQVLCELVARLTPAFVATTSSAASAATSSKCSSSTSGTVTPLSPTSGCGRRSLTIQFPPASVTCQSA